MNYEPNIESVRKHQAPEWFHDAKLGIFIHWGLFSVPAFAITGIDMMENMRKYGMEAHFKNNPYAEWYLNTMKIEGSPTQEYHNKTYGKDFSYHDFIPMFNEAIKSWNPDEMAEIFKEVGAKYVILVTRHCDGFILWPSKQPNPNLDISIAERDIVGELTEAVKKRGMKMGYYYCSAWDWTFNTNTIKDQSTFYGCYKNPPEYTDYVTKHWYELIDNYKPTILWSDMGYPPGNNHYELIAYFYNKTPDGVINNRWNHILVDEKRVEKNHYDFQTPEYTSFKRKKKFKWEACRGIGNSFGYNKFEKEEDHLSLKSLIRMLIDIVSKNGNLLLNVGPMADGTIPEIQKTRLYELGKWLKINGEAIFGTRPWKKPNSKTLENIEVRYTHKNNILYVFLLDQPRKKEITIQSLNIEANSSIELLGQEGDLAWNHENKNLKIILPDNLEESPAYIFKINLKS